MAAVTPAKKGGKVVRLAVAFALVTAIGFASGLSVGAASGSRFLSNIPLFGDGLDATPDESADLSAFWKVWNALDAQFVETTATSTRPTTEERVWAAIQGLTEAYGDPYTVFMPPADAKIFQEDISGNFGGVGMEIGVSDEGVLTVIAPLKDTPAARAGIKSGDLIIRIDDKSTDGMSSDEAVKIIRGPKGSVVTLGLMRDGEVLTIKVTRDLIQVPTIDNSYDAATGVYTISLYSFTANSGNLFSRALSDFRASGSNKLLVDLRGNPGGYLDAAVTISSFFLAKGDVIVTEDYRGTQENVVHRSRGTGGVPAGTKVVVLIDRGSASASEILAGALQDAKVATLVGGRSFGKGSVQELLDVNGGALKVTVARWLTPSGRSISDGGLAPDIAVEFTKEDLDAERDPQKARAIEYLRVGQ